MSSSVSSSVGGSAVELEAICEECGDDLVCEGFTVCTECLEAHGDPREGRS